MIKLMKARRAGNVARYHTLRLAHSENVAQHSFNVVNMLLAITGGKASKQLILAALHHDLGEIETGDIPSPTKKAMGAETKDWLDDVEDRVLMELFPQEYFPLSAEDELLLKLADNMDGLAKCYEELRAGNKEIRAIGDRYVSYIYKLLDVTPCTLATALIYHYQKEALS